MSFSSDLWNNTGKIQKEFWMKFNELWNITEVFKRLAKAEIAFADEIKRISILNKQMSNYGSLAKSTTHFFTFLVSTSKIYKNHANTLIDWIITPTGKFINEQLKLTNQHFEDIIQKEQHLSLKSASLESFKKEYHRFAAKLIQSTIKLEELITRNEINQDEMKIEIENQHQCSDNLRISKMEYINYLDKFNNYRDGHNAKIKFSLNTLQLSYIDLVGYYKWAFLTSEIYYKTLVKELKEENKRAEGVFQTLVPQNDLKEFIEKHRSTAFPMQRCEFVQFKVDNAMLANVSLPNNVKDNIKAYIKDEVKYVQPKKDDYTHENVKMIENFIQTSWIGDIDQITKTYIIGLLKESKFNRANLLAVINTYRPKGMFKISDATYALLLELLTVVLNSCLIDSDYETIKRVIIISQTFYRQNDNDKKNKEDLQNGLMGHPIFHQRDIWEGIIKYSVHEEVVRKTKLSNSAVIENKMKNLISIIMITTTFNMYTFGVSNDIIKDLTDYFCKVYQIDNDMLKSKENEKIKIINMSNDVIKSDKDKEMKIIEDCSTNINDNNNEIVNNCINNNNFNDGNGIENIDNNQGEIIADSSEIIEQANDQNDLNVCNEANGNHIK